MEATNAAEAAMHRLRELRLDRAWSQDELARAAGVTKETISRLERGENEPQPRTLAKLAKALGVQPKVLRCGPPVAEAASA